jgi:hypothetical protein
MFLPKRINWRRWFVEICWFINKTFTCKFIPLLTFFATKDYYQLTILNLNTVPRRTLKSRFIYHFNLNVATLGIVL